MVSFLDLNYAAHVYEMCDLVSLGRLAAVNREMHELVARCLKIKIAESTYKMRICFRDYGIDSVLQAGDMFWIKPNGGWTRWECIRMLAEIFNNFYCKPIYYREPVRDNYRNAHKEHENCACCSKRRTLFHIRQRERRSASFLQALGWAIRPVYGRKHEECRDFM